MSQLNRVILESPFRGSGYSKEQDNVQFARDCTRAMAIVHGEAALASHLLWPQALWDDNPEERALGIECGNAWRHVADYTVFYTDLGWSQGMIDALAICLRDGLEFYLRGLLVGPKLPPRLKELSLGDQALVKTATKGGRG